MKKKIKQCKIKAQYKMKKCFINNFSLSTGKKKVTE